MPNRATAVPDLSLAMLLSAAGGSLDAYTWLAQGGVFANAQTGNVVLLAVNAAAGNWAQAVKHLLPICAFVLGVFAAQAIRANASASHRLTAAHLSIAIEIILLLMIMLLPIGFPSVGVTLAIAFVAALQNSSFTRVAGRPYNSVMTTGNLRKAAEAFYSLCGRRAEWRSGDAVVFSGLCLAFAAGAAGGALATVWRRELALLFSVCLLAVALWRCSAPASATVDEA